MFSLRFLCPFAGLYYVSVALTKYSSFPLDVCVSKSTEPFLHSVDRDRSNKYYTVSNAAVIRCQKDEVIVVEGTGKGNIEGAGGTGDSIFTVMLLLADGNP